MILYWQIMPYSRISILSYRRRNLSRENSLGDRALLKIQLLSPHFYEETRRSIQEIIFIEDEEILLLRRNNIDWMRNLEVIIYFILSTVSSSG